jgi:hypothetical protein
MGEESLPTWKNMVNGQPFATATAPQTLVDVVSSLVSREKLLAWEQFGHDQKVAMSGDFTLFPNIRMQGLALSLFVLVLTYAVLPLYPRFTLPDPVAAR